MAQRWRPTASGVSGEDFLVRLSGPKLNDLCRTAPGVAGRLFQTSGIDAFHTDEGQRHPGDPKQTARVLTIMLASEY